MRVLVCGGRSYFDREWIFHVLDHYHSSNAFTCLIHGAATGADSIAAEWAWSRVPIEPYPADWDRYGRGAGMRRNAQMLREGKPNVVIAFPGGSGTLNMILQSRRANLPVLEIPSRSG